MNRILSTDTDTLFPVRIVRGALILNGESVAGMVDHFAEEIRISNRVPRWRRPELIRQADAVARADVEQSRAFANVYRADDKGGFIVQPAPYRSPSRPHVRAGVRREFAAYSVPRVVRIDSYPHRPLSSARALCRRVYKDPSYLDVIRVLRMPGVTFLAPTSRRGRRVA